MGLFSPVPGGGMDPRLACRDGGSEVFQPENSVGVQVRK